MWEIYLQWFKQEEAAGIPVEAVLEKLPPDDSAIADQVRGDERESVDFWRTSYGPQTPHVLNCVDIYPSFMAGIAELGSLSASRPTSDARFWQAFFELLEMGHGIAYADGSYPLVAREATIPHLPADMVETLGNPRVVTCGADIVAAIKEW